MMVVMVIYDGGDVCGGEGNHNVEGAGQGKEA